MPYSKRNIYVEVESAGLLNHRFKILIEYNKKSNELQNFIRELSILKEYLNDVIDSTVQIDIFINSTIPQNDLMWKDIKPVILEEEISNSKERILQLVKKVNADLIVTENKEIIDSFSKEEFNFLVEGYDNAKKNIEIFVRGHEIPWSFPYPSWNMPWETFYPMCDEFGIKALDMYNNYNKMGLGDQTRELIRSLLLNRVSHICYTRDKLLFYTQQKRHAKRHEWKSQDFHFEASYFLCHYYLLFWGGTDQISRILNNVLSLGCNEFKIGISKKKFVNKISSVDKNLGKLYESEDFIDWINKLKSKRHYTAHEGTIRLAPLLIEPEKKLSDEELEKEAQADPMWEKMRNFLGEEEFTKYHNNAKELIRISKYEVLIDDAMFINDGPKSYYFRPLLDIEWDFDNFKSITIKTFELLFNFLKNTSVKP